MIPPFYIGQRVVAIRDHSKGNFKKGDEFVIQNIRPNTCNCIGWEVYIGINNPIWFFQICYHCKAFYPTDNGKMYYRHTSFAPILEDFKPMEYTTVIEKEPVSLN